LRVLFVFVVLAHHRRRVLHFNVTDRDSVYGHVFRERVKGMGVREVLTAPHSPWQNLSFAKTPSTGKPLIGSDQETNRRPMISTLFSLLRLL
jgi:hypothetical protein